MRRGVWLLGLSICTGGCVVAKEGTFFYDGIDRVEVELGNGDLAVVPSQSEETVLELSMGGVSMSPVGPEQRGRTLVVVLTCEGVCGGDVFLEVPDGLDLDLRVHRGDLSVDDVVAGRLDLIVGAGDLSGVGLDVGRLGVAVGAGDGDVQADVVDCVWAEVGAGDGSVAVPAGDYRIDADVGAGELDIDAGLRHAAQADRCIHAEVGLGTLDLVAN